MIRDSKHKGDKVPMLESFYKSQISSVIATSVDFGVFFFLSRLCGVYFVWANAIGATAGALVSFFLGRHWAFRRKDKGMKGQAFRYAITSAMSVVINTYGMYWMTTYFGLPDYVSKIIVSILIGIFFNYLMFRYFVYR